MRKSFQTRTASNDFIGQQKVAKCWSVKRLAHSSCKAHQKAEKIVSTYQVPLVLFYHLQGGRQPDGRRSISANDTVDDLDHYFYPK